MFGFNTNQNNIIGTYCQTINQALMTNQAKQLCSCFTTNLNNHAFGDNLVQMCKMQNDFKQYTMRIEDKIMAELANLHLLLLKNYSDDIRQLVEYQMKLLKQVCSTTMINNLMPIYIPLIIQIFKETLSLIKHSRISHPIFDVKMNSDYSQYVRGLLSNVKNNTYGFGQNLVVSAYNCFIKSCFQQLNYKACQDIYESFKDEVEKQIEMSPKNEVCTYYYYQGRTKLYSEEYDLALHYFSKALDICDETHETNLSRIYFFMIPLQMKKEKIPPQSLLQRFHFDFYSQVAYCLQVGDVLKMEDLINQNKEMIIKRGLFLVMNEIQSLVSMHLVIRTIRVVNTNKVYFSTLQFAFQYYGLELNDDQLVWLLTSLNQLKCQININSKFVVFKPSYLTSTS